MEKFSERLYDLRKESGVSQKTVAQAIGATQKAVDFWEKGINEPKASFIVALAKYFKVSTDFLLGLED